MEKDYEFIKQTGANLREIRKASGLSCEQIAGALGITAASYRHLETGYTELTVSRLKDLAEIFQVAMGKILGEGTDVANMIDALREQIRQYADNNQPKTKRKKPHGLK